MLFKRLHHQKIALILAGLNPQKLSQACCYFGGGTAIALKFDEYRESVDIDLMVSDKDGYRQLRSDATDVGGLANLFHADHQLDLSTDVRADQYGIRSFIKVLDTKIKFEIVLEGRISFDVPTSSDSIMGISCLTTTDLLASKLLANSDRWGDASVFNRDLIDIVMMQFSEKDWARAYQKAHGAYGAAINNDLLKACNTFLDNKTRRAESLKILKIEITESSMVEKVRRLQRMVTKLIC